ncbi:uncharacterized protein [Leptinotarsa decemlineata]|uniref:uncharacterized protein n=1 Tax=Leptinotarsa decemlineata TaxID=7539 RepID=UPI003D304497
MRNYLNMKPKNYYIKHLTDNGLTMNSTDTNFTATRINANRSNGSSEEDASTKIGSNRIHMHKYLNLRPQNATSLHLAQKHAIVGSLNEQIIRQNNENSSVDSTTNKTEEKWTHKRKYFNLKLKNDSIAHLAKFSKNNIVTQDSTLNNSNMNSSDTVLREKEQRRFHMRKYLNLKQRNSYNLTENHPLNRSIITTHFKTSILNASSIGEAEHSTKDEIINSNSSDVSHTTTHVNGNGISAGIVINNLENSVTHIPKYLNLKPENESVIHTTENSTIANVTDGNIATASSISSSGVNSVGIDTTKTESKRFHTRKYLNRQFKNTTDRLTENNPTYGNNTTHYSINSIEGSSQSEDETTTEHKMIHMRKYLNMKPKNGTENKSSDANSDTVQLKENRSFEEAVTKERVANVSKHFNVKLENSSNGISPNTVVIKRFHMRKYLNLKPKNSSNHFEENHTADESINTTRIFTNISSESKTETTTEHHMFHTQKYVNMTYENITENNSTNGNAAKTNLEGNGDTVKKTNNTENYIINIPDVNLETDSSKHLTENTNESIVSPYIIPNSTNGSLSDVGLIKMEHENFHMRKYLTLKPKGSTNHLTENDIVINRTGGSASPHLSSTNESLADTSINQIEHQRIHMRPYLSLISKTFPNHFIKKDVIMNTTDEYNSSPDFDITNGSYVGAGKNKTDQLKIHLEQDLDLKFENYSNHLSENNVITNNTGVYSSRHLIVTEANGSHADTNKTENHRIHMRKYLDLTPKISSNNLRENNAVMNITVAESRNLTEHQSLQIEKYHNLTNSTDISNHLIENNAIVNSTYGFSATPHLNISKTSKSDINEDTNKTKHTKFHTRTYLNLKPDNSSKHLKENSVMNSTDKIIIKSSKTEANSVKTNISGSSEKPKYLHLNHKNDTLIHHSHSNVFTNSLSQNGASEKLTTDDTPTTENSEITFTSSTVHPTVSSFKESSMNTNEATTTHNIMHIPKYFDIKPEHSLTLTVTDRNEVTTEYNTEAPTTVVQTGGEISILLGKEIVDSAQINYSSSTTAQSHEMNEVKNEKILLNSTDVSLEHTKERSSNTLEDEEFQSSRMLIEKIPSSGNFNLGNNIAVVGGISEVPVDENVQTSSFFSTEIDTAKDDETAAIPQHKYNIIHQLLDASVTTSISTTSTKTESNMLTSFENQNKTDLSSEYSTNKSELSLVSSESSDSVRDTERYRNESSLEQNISAEINTSSESPKHFPSPLVLSIQSATEEEIANTFLEHIDVIPTTPFAMTEIGLNPEVSIKTGESSVELSKETLITNNEHKISDAGQYNNKESTISIISTSSSVTTSEGDLAVIIPSEYHEISTKLPDKLTIIDDSYTSHLLNEENTVTSEASPSPEINTHLEYSTETLTMSLFSSSETPKREETVYIKHKSEFTEISEGPDVNNSKISVENRKHIKQEFEEKLPQVANTMTLDIESLLNATSNEYVNEANFITSETNPSSEINENFKYSTETPSFSSPDTLTRDKIIYINDSSIYPFSVISTSLPNDREIDNESEDIKVMITNNTISSSVETDNKSEPESVTENIITPAIIQIKKNNTETVKHLLKVGRFEETTETTETTEKDNFVSNYSQNIGDAITEELLSSYTDNTNGVTVALQKIVTLDSAHWYGVDVLSTTTQSVISNNDSEYDEILDNTTEGEGSTIYAKDRKRELTTISEIFSTEQTELLTSHDIELSQTLEQEKEFVTVDPAHWYGVESETEINNTKVPEAGEALVLRGRINMHQLINDSFASSETVANQITFLTASKVVNGFKEVTTEEKPAIDITTIPLSEATKTVEIVSNNTVGDDKRFGSSESVINQITFLTSSGTKVKNGLNGDITIGANVVTDIPQYGVAGTEKEKTVQNGLFHVANTSKKIFDNRFGTSETVENQITSLVSLSTNMDSDFIDDIIEGTSEIDVTSISHSAVNESEKKKPAKSELHQLETISKKFSDSKDGHHPLDELTGIDLQEGGNKSDENESIISRVSQTVSLENNAEYIENTLSSSTNLTSATHNVTLKENTANLTTLSNIQANATDSVTDRNESISKLVHSYEEKIATKFNDGINRNESLSTLNKSNSENQGKVSESGKLEELNRELTQTNYTSEINEEVEKAKNTRTSSSTELNMVSLIENTTEQRELSDGELNRGSLITDESETVYVSSTINDESAFTKTEELNHNISKSAVENRIQIKQEFEETTSHVVNNTNESATAASSEKSNMINSTIKPISTNSDILESKVRTSSEVTLTKTTEDTVTEDELAIVSGEELTDDVTVVKIEFLEPIEFESVTRSTTQANKEETVYANVNEEVQQEYAVPYIKKKIFENDANFSVQLKIQNKTIYMPSDVAIIEDPKHLMLNFTWPSSENTFNYSLSLGLNESTLGYLINKISLNFLKAGLTLKEAGKLQEDDLSVDSGILVTFSNTDFLRKQVEEKNSSNLQKASEKRQDHIFYIEIILVAVIVVILIISVVSILLSKRRKPKTPEVEDKDVTTRL